MIESRVLSTSRGGSHGDGGGSGVATALTATSRPRITAIVPAVVSTVYCPVARLHGPNDLI